MEKFIVVYWDYTTRLKEDFAMGYFCEDFSDEARPLHGINLPNGIGIYYIK